MNDPGPDDAGGQKSGSSGEIGAGNGVSLNANDASSRCVTGFNLCASFSNYFVFLH
jgi:hypothetical protein